MILQENKLYARNVVKHISLHYLLKLLLVHIVGIESMANEILNKYNGVKKE
jgi:hypothetical protein